MRERALCWMAFAALALGPSGPARAQWHAWSLEDRAYFAPTLADPRAAVLKIAFPVLTESVPYAVHDRPGLAWDITMGKELPVVGFSDSTLSSDWVEAGRSGFGLWLPVGFHMIEDLGKDRSNPILNVDYRFGLMAKAQRGLRWSPRGALTVVGAQVHVGHESTHIGDEFTVNAIERHGSTFRRVNVSYQFVEGALQAGARFESWRARAQARCLWVVFTGEESWYGRALEYPTGATVTTSSRNYEPSFALEAAYEGDPNALSWTWFRRPFVSIDLRPRTVYGYDRASVAAGEDVQWSVNAMAGIRPPVVWGGGLSHLYLRGFYGVNPAGQFRSQRDYWLFGVGLAFLQEEQ